jgi:hypothetical protein
VGQDSILRADLQSALTGGLLSQRGRLKTGQQDAILPH